MSLELWTRARETLGCIAGTMAGSAAVLFTAGRWDAAVVAAGACFLATLVWSLARLRGMP